MLISTGSITVNTFLVQRVGTQGRWRWHDAVSYTAVFAFKEVTSVLGWTEGQTQRHQVGDPQRLWGMRDKEPLGGLPDNLGSQWPPDTEQWVPNLEGAADLGTLTGSPILHPLDLRWRLEAEWGHLTPRRQRCGLSSACRWE